MKAERFEIPVERLTCVCDPDELGFDTTDELEPLEGTIGQERAVSALEFGLGIEAQGFNLFVAGATGTGRTTTLAAYLQRVARSRPVPPDWCYVHNFDDPSRPLALSLPPGMGSELAKDMDDIVNECRVDIPRMFEGEEYRQRVEEMLRDIQERRTSLSREIETEAKRRHFSVNFGSMGLITLPLNSEGQSLGRDEFDQLPEEEQSFIQQRLVELKRLDKEANERRSQLDRELVAYGNNQTFLDLKEKYADLTKVVDYLEKVQRDIAEHVETFKTREEEQQGVPFLSSPPEEKFIKCKVNVIVRNNDLQGAPVVFEYSPTFYNLFGRIEYRARLGAAMTDLTMIKPGALHRANGGFLVVQARDLISSFLAWETMKHTLRSQEIRIENLGEQLSAVPTTTISPEPIPLNAKIVMVGNPSLLRLLQLYDEDFPKFFKVKADFDVVMNRTPENIRKYASFVVNRVRGQGLLPFDKTAVARLVEYSSRMVEHQHKLTTRFIDVADLITEANYWACQDGNCSLVTGEHVRRAIQERIFRSNLPEERIQEYINDGTIRIQTEGAVVGQVNGLAILGLGDYTFGKPTRITARTSLGRGEVANIDYETQMSGRIHNKGFMILVGYLMGKYSRDKPLAVKASIGFEQTYDEVEGDSASCAELYTLLSSLSGLPLKQGLAVTGSVNQHGQVQAIGGATRKIEGFFDVCKVKGLNGSQGVIIPQDNVKNLVLREDVIQAVREGKFHIYAVSSIEEGVELLTGVPAGERRRNGTYEKGSVNYYIDQNLRRMAKKAREAAQTAPDSQRRKGGQKAATKKAK